MCKLPRQIIKEVIINDDAKPFSVKQSPILDEHPSYDMNVVTKEWNIAEKISRLSWDWNPVLPDKNLML